MPEMSHTVTLTDHSLLTQEGTTLVIASPATVSEASFSIPAVRAISQGNPKGILIILANQETTPMWRKVSEVDRVLTHQRSDSARKIARLLKNSAISFTASISWENNSSAQAFAKHKIPHRFGYPDDKLTEHLTNPVEIERKIGPIEHQVNHYLHFLSQLGIDPFQASYFTPPPRPPSASTVRIAIAPGSDYGPAAEWPIEHFCDLAQKISSYGTLSIISSPGRAGPATTLAKSLDQQTVSAEGDALLEHLASCQGLITNDGSIAHYASFVGTPSLVLFGPNEPEWKRPLGRIHQILRHHVPCSACLLNKCPLDHRCMTNITVSEVLEKIPKLIKI